MDSSPALSVWARFWQVPVRAERLAFMRIALGMTLFAEQWIEFLPYLMEFYGPEGVAPAGLHDRVQLKWWYWPMLIFNTDEPTAVYGMFFLWMAVTFLFAIGFLTRLMNVALWFLTACFMVRNYLLLCGSDDTLQISLFLLLFAPCGRALSVDSWLRRRRGFDVGPVYTVAWPLRLIQIQLCVIYFTTGLVKLKGTGWFEGTWWEGTSIHYTLNYLVMSRYSYATVPVPFWLTKFMTYVVVWWEVLFPLLVIYRPTRMPALLFGILFHVGIFVTMSIGWFGFYTMCLYTVWVTDEFWARWCDQKVETPPVAA